MLTGSQPPSDSNAPTRLLCAERVGHELEGVRPLAAGAVGTGPDAAQAIAAADLEFDPPVGEFADLDVVPAHGPGDGDDLRVAGADWFAHDHGVYLNLKYKSVAKVCRQCSTVRVVDTGLLDVQVTL
jgi:hypothetical protein